MPILIGTGSNQVPTNGDLGTMAFQDSAAISVGIANVSGNVAIGGITTLAANVILGSSGLSANGGFGTAGQLLNSNGTATYWAADRSANAYTNAVSYVDGKSYVNTSQLSSNLANYQTTAGLAANVATLAANSSTYANASITNAFTVGTSTYFVSNGNVGVGTSSPSTMVDVYSLTSAQATIRGDSVTSVIIARSSTDASGPNIIVRKARGTGASPTAVANSDNIGGMVFSAYGGTTNRTVGFIRGYIDTYTSDTDISSYLNFATTPAGSVTALERVRITASGNVGIGNTTPDAKLTVTGTANISGDVVIGGITTHNANVILGSSGLSANGGFGTAGQVLSSNGTATYWSTVSGGGGDAAAAYTNAVAYVDGKSYVNTSQLSSNLANYQTSAGLSANVATLTANNATNLGGVPAASYVNTSGSYTITGMLTYSNGITFSNTITANGSNGTAGQVLTSSGATGNVYWSTASGGGGGITTGKAIAMALIFG